MDAQLRELIPFLRDKNPQVRALALENLVSQTPTGSPHRNIFFAGLGGGGLQKPKECDVIRDLKLLCRDQPNIAHDAFRALVNLSDSPLLISPLSEAYFITFIVSYILNPKAILADLACMLLSNLTASSSACSTLLTLRVPVIQDSRLPTGFFPVDSRSTSCPPLVPYPTGQLQQILALPLLIDAFVHGATIDNPQDIPQHKRKGELNFLAGVFANLTVSPAGRNYFLTPKSRNILKPRENLEFPLSRLVTFTEHKDKIRRGGVASALKNCAFFAAGHKAILSPESERVSVPTSTAKAPGVDALPYLLLPLAGPEDFDLEDQEQLLEPLQFLPPEKRRETDPAIRLTHIETLLLLCHTKWGRDYLRTHGVYEIIRTAHEDESVDKISEQIERLVLLLKGDEPSAPLPEEEDISAFEIEKGLTVNKATYSVPVSGTPVQETAADGSNADNRIDEV